MPRSAGKTVFKRTFKAKHRSRGQDDFEALFDIGPYDRNEITLTEINKLRKLIDSEGMPAACKEIGVCDVTLLRVCAGFAHQLVTPTRKLVREYLRG